MALLLVATPRVALGQVYELGYRNYPRYAAYPQYEGYPGYPTYPGYPRYPGYPGYGGYPGSQGYNGYQGFVVTVGYVSSICGVGCRWWGSRGARFRMQDFTVSNVKGSATLWRTKLRIAWICLR